MTKSVITTLLISTLPHILSAQQSAMRDFSKETARTSQDWVKDAVIYEIFPRNYSQKGDFNSITNDLDRLQNLGVTILWLMPIHPVGKERSKGSVGSPYAVKDFYAINSDYGTKTDLQKLVTEAHKRQMKVIIDIVANHTAWDSVMMADKSFYTTDKSGAIISPVADWKDVADLNYDNPKLREYMTKMLVSWIRDYDLDGFRCDVAGFIPTDYWESLRPELEKIKPNIVMLAEWNSPDLLVKAFDLDYSWSIHSAMTEVLQGTKPASFIAQTWQDDKAKFPRNALRMRFSDNHDERRSIVRFSEKGALAAQTLAFTLDGVPMLYNGMEVGDTTESGAPALFEKLPIFWQIAERRPEFPRFYKEMIALRKSQTALRRGDLNWLKNSDEARILTFTRNIGTESLLVAINMTNSPFVGLVEAGGNYQEITPEIGAPLPPDDDKSKVRAKSKVALPSISLDAFGYRIFRKKE
ncbi:MAG: alpha-amylase [Pyrinomonadaceae bacterium]|nr:alpha-amylase [Pyrinomonadaceae bacterium]